MPLREEAILRVKDNEKALVIRKDYKRTEKAENSDWRFLQNCEDCSKKAEEIYPSDKRNY